MNLPSTVVVSLDKAGGSPMTEIGGKAANLASLLRAGFPVPKGIVITTAAFARFVEVNGFGPGTKPEGVRAADLPPDVSAALESALKELGGPVAVRSSGVAEDLAGASYAGQYETVLGVEAHGAGPALLRCWSSAFNERVLGYHQASGHHGIPPMAVLIQIMVPAQIAGVAFTANPVTGDKEVMVNAVQGLSDRLVSGEVDADQWSVRDGEVERHASGTRVLAVDQVIGIADLARRVETHFGSPQDIEWAMADGDIHLLQARPITTLTPSTTEAPIVAPPGYWEREASHAPQPLTPFTRSIFYGVVNGGLAPAVAEFGALIETIEYRDIGGWTYMRAVPLGGGKDRPAPPGWLMPLLIRLIRPMRKRIRRSVEAVRTDLSAQVIDQWQQQWRTELVSQIAARRSVALADLSDEELKAELRSALELFEQGARRHFLLHLAICLPLAEIAFCSRELIGWDESKIWDLLAGLSTMSTEPARRLAQLAATIAARPALQEILERNGPEVVDRLVAADESFAEGLADYMDRFGGRALSYETADLTLAESPELTASLIRDQLKRGFDPKITTAEMTKRRQATLAEARDRLAARDPADRERWEKALARAETAYPVREDNVFYTISAPLALVRYAALEIGNRLRDRSQLVAASDVFFLTREGAAEALDDGRPRVDVVAQGQAELNRVRAHPGPANYGKDPGPPPPLDALPPGARLVNQALLWYVERIFQTQNSGQDGTSEEIRGIAASAGRYRGQVRIVMGENEFGKLGSGDVLVCPMTSPAWSVLFPTIGALVTDNGGILSHPAIIAREYRIPSVVATGNATKRLRDGQIVTVDGTTGVVEATEPPTRTHRPDA